MRLINGDHLEERVRKIIKDYAQAAKDSNIMPGRVIFSSCGVIGLIQSESTADAVPVIHGQWIPYNSKHGHDKKVYLCNQCNNDVGFTKMNFCPNCGADMREDGDGNDTV